MTRARRRRFAAAILPVVALLAGLGWWQIDRLAWKNALIAAVDARLAAAPVPAPVGTAPPYTRVVATGRYRAGADTYTQAVTALGPGWWVLTPFDDARGLTILVNRGFVPAAMRGQAPPPRARRVTGLVRATEPGGGFLRANDPAAGRWYSRDVAAIAAARGIGRTAPYFVDAVEVGEGARWPRGGLTVVRFRNPHLAYALTWFAMASGLAAMAAWLWWAPAGASLARLPPSA